MSRGKYQLIQCFSTVAKTRERMAPLVASARYADDFLRLQLAHLDQLRTYSTVSAEVDLDFPGIEEIRDRYSTRPQRRSDDTSASSPWDRSQPPSRRDSRKASTSGRNLFQSTYTMGTKPWSRRAVLDRHGERVDPLTQVDLALKDAAEKEDEMQQSRVKTRNKLQDMSQEIADLEYTKNRIRNELELQTANVSQGLVTVDLTPQYATWS